MKAILPQRRADKFGSGEYLAPRGHRKHQGVDFACYPGTKIISFTDGIVTKIGYPYSEPDRQFLHYIQISHEGKDYRYFYVSPLLKVGDEVKAGDVIAISISLQKVYDGITDHVHFEVKCNNLHLDPTPYTEGFP